MGVEVEGLDSLLLRLRRLGDIRNFTPIKRALIRVGSGLAAQIRIELRRSGLRRRTGDLANSIDFDIREGNLGPEVVAGSFGVRYAAVHEFGATIRPRRAKALRFQIPGGGWVTTKRVTIPARPYVRPALDKRKERILQILSKATTQKG